MPATEKVVSLSVAEYLAGELQSKERHEYLGGSVYAMAGASDTHNTISLNLASALRTHLRGGPCRVYMADLKLRLQISDEDVFYYPDVMVACDPRDTDPYARRFSASVDRSAFARHGADGPAGKIPELHPD